MEHVNNDDVKCLEQYCRLYGITIGKHTRKFDPTEGRAKCPRYSQIRLLAVFAHGAKGPVWSRSLHRKLLGNETYCLQIDAHSEAIPQWDEVSIKEWHATQNDYAVISTLPPSPPEGTGSNDDVTRLCRVEGGGGGERPIPAFVREDEEMDVVVKGLNKPLLGHSWSAGFSFSKCHLAEYVPYDNFLPQMFDNEEFPYFTRFWTRGYDVYTPTRNIIYHEPASTAPDNVDKFGWRHSEKERKESLTRLKTLLQLDGGENNVRSWSNLGVYGLGRRRTLRQLMEYIGWDFHKGKAMMAKTGEWGERCGVHRWVPYDSTIEAWESMYNDIDEDRDPMPEFPLRKTTARPEQDIVVSSLMNGESFDSHQWEGKGTMTTTTTVPMVALGLFWILGLAAWYAVFIRGYGRIGYVRRSKKKTSGKQM